MSYDLQYRAIFSNKNNEVVTVNFYKKDGGDPVDGVQSYEVTSMEINHSSDVDDVTSWIIYREMVIKLFVPPTDSYIDWETFLTSANDEWKVIADIDGNYVFHGFIVPEESPTDFQDKPYELTILCTDGLKLLNQVEITDPNGDPFTCIDPDGYTDDLRMYLATCLAKTNLDLNFRIYCDIYESSMVNRSTGSFGQSDAFNQTKLERRAFGKTVTSMMSCFEVLEAMLKDNFKLFYFNGYWVIKRLGTYQYQPGGNYYTEYRPDGSLPNELPTIDPDNYGQVGKNQIIFPINRDQQISAKFAAKTVAHEFNYDIWEEIPSNAKFVRGTLDSTSPAPDEYDKDGDGNTSEIIGTNKYYTIDCWQYGKDTKSGLPGPSPTSGTAFRKSTFNDFGIELSRQIELTPEVTGTAEFCMLESQGIPVTEGDIIGFNLSFRVEIDGGFTGASIMYIYIVPDDGSPTLFLDNQTPGVAFQWIATTGIMIFGVTSGSPTVFSSYTTEASPCTKTGTLYVALWGGNTMTYGKKIYKDFELRYTPFTAGGYVPITGDKWARTNPTNFIDGLSTTVNISDSAKKIIKGSLLRISGTELTTPSWYRYGLTETRHWKELQNLAVYNLKYRRFRRIEGSFNSTVYSPENDQTVIKPLNFGILYEFSDMADTPRFMLVTPVRQDIVKGTFNGTFIEVWKDSNDGTQEPTSSFTYKFDN